MVVEYLSGGASCPQRVVMQGSDERSDPGVHDEHVPHHIGARVPVRVHDSCACHRGATWPDFYLFAVEVETHPALEDVPGFVILEVTMERRDVLTLPIGTGRCDPLDEADRRPADLLLDQ